MYKRLIEKELQDLAQGYPVVTVVGPRQSGKTTVVRHTFPDKPYANLEEVDVREMALFDEKEQKGMFILTGSHQMELHGAVSQSLAGRTALLTLLPLSLEEMKKEDVRQDLDNLLLHGGYPRIYRDKLDPIKAYRNYFRTYVERDLRQIIQVKDLSQFQRFVRICAGRIGQVLNLEGISNDVGVSSNTVKEWLSVLEASFVITRLQPYFENFGKRLIKSPKLYFTDVGLACYLLGIENSVQIERDPLRGNLIENLVLLELMKCRLNQGVDPQLYYYRDAHGNEVDLIFQSGRKLIPIEVKASRTFHKDFLKNLKFFKELAPDRVSKGFLVYAGKQEQQIQDFHTLNYAHTHQIIQGIY